MTQQLFAFIISHKQMESTKQKKKYKIGNLSLQKQMPCIMNYLCLHYWTCNTVTKFDVYILFFYFFLVAYVVRWIVIYALTCSQLPPKQIDCGCCCRFGGKAKQGDDDEHVDGLRRLASSTVDRFDLSICDSSSSSRSGVNETRTFCAKFFSTTCSAIPSAIETFPLQPQSALENSAERFVLVIKSCRVGRLLAPGAA